MRKSITVEGEGIEVMPTMVVYARVMKKYRVPPFLSLPTPSSDFDDSTIPSAPSSLLLQGNASKPSSSPLSTR
ncbi:hypothetical protein AKJ16_DCAP09116 [Drosera capensis]